MLQLTSLHTSLLGLIFRNKIAGSTIVTLVKFLIHLAKFSSRNVAIYAPDSSVTKAYFQKPLSRLVLSLFLSLPI